MIGPAQIGTMTVAANTTMLHLLAGEDPLADRIPSVIELALHRIHRRGLELDQGVGPFLRLGELFELLI